MGESIGQVSSENHQQVYDAQLAGSVFDNFPEELLLAIFRQLDLPSCCALALVNRHFHRISPECIISSFLAHLMQDSPWRCAAEGDLSTQTKSWFDSWRHIAHWSLVDKTLYGSARGDLAQCRLGRESCPPIETGWSGSIEGEALPRPIHITPLQTAFGEDVDSVAAEYSDGIHFYNLLPTGMKEIGRLDKPIACGYSLFFRKEEKLVYAEVCEGRVAAWEIDSEGVCELGWVEGNPISKRSEATSLGQVPWIIYRETMPVICLPTTVPFNATLLFDVGKEIQYTATVPQFPVEQDIEYVAWGEGLRLTMPSLDGIDLIDGQGGERCSSIPWPAEAFGYLRLFNASTSKNKLLIAIGDCGFAAYIHTPQPGKEQEWRLAALVKSTIRPELGWVGPKGRRSALILYATGVDPRKSGLRIWLPQSPSSSYSIGSADLKETQLRLISGIHPIIVSVTRKNRLKVYAPPHILEPPSSPHILEKPPSTQMEVPQIGAIPLVPAAPRPPVKLKLISALFFASLLVLLWHRNRSAQRAFVQPR